MYRMFTFLVLVPLYSLVLLAQGTTDSVQLAAWDRFKARNGSNWDIRWDNRYAVPRSIFGSASLRYSNARDAADAASNFLAENSLLFGRNFSVNQLQYLRSRLDSGITVVDYQQMYRGLPVCGGEFSVIVNANNSIGMLRSQYFPNIIAPTTPAVAKPMAFRIAVDSLKIPEPDSSSIRSDLEIVPVDDEYHLAYHINITNWDIFVEAMSGKILSSWKTVFDVDGTGKIYSIDPIQSSLQTAGIPRLAGNGYLDGTYAQALNLEQNRASSPTNDFSYTPPSYYTT